MPTESNVGARLRASRERAALTQEQVAGRLDVSRELVSMWETESRQPTRAQLDALAALYRIPLSFVTGAKPPLSEIERGLVLGALPDRDEVRAAVAEWLDFLERWAVARDTLGLPLPGPGRPPRALDHGPSVTDARRAPTLADEVRDYYGLGRNALPGLRQFLDERGVLVYRSAFGPLDLHENAVAGAYYNHPRLGACLLVNTDMSPGRQAFAMAHGYAHALYHYGERAVVCRTDTDSSVERFANTFAPHFLVPRKKLREMVERLVGSGPLDAYKAVHLASFFRVSYPTTLRRLLTEHHIDEAEYERLSRLSPQGLAERVGVDAAHFRLADPVPTGPDRYPLSVLRTAIEALRHDRLPVSDIARIMGVEPSTVEDELVAEPPSASPEEMREFHELP